MCVDPPCRWDGESRERCHFIRTRSEWLECILRTGYDDNWNCCHREYVRTERKPMQWNHKWNAICSRRYVSLKRSSVANFCQWILQNTNHQFATSAVTSVSMHNITRGDSRSLISSSIKQLTGQCSRDPFWVSGYSTHAILTISTRWELDRLYHNLLLPKRQNIEDDLYPWQYLLPVSV